MPSHTHTLQQTVLRYSGGGLGNGNNNNYIANDIGNNATLNNTGGGLPHENRQPYLVVNYIIKY